MIKQTEEQNLIPYLMNFTPLSYNSYFPSVYLAQN